MNINTFSITIGGLAILLLVGMMFSGSTSLKPGPNNFLIQPVYGRITADFCPQITLKSPPQDFSKPGFTLTQNSKVELKTKTANLDPGIYDGILTLSFDYFYGKGRGLVVDQNTLRGTFVLKSQDGSSAKFPLNVQSYKISGDFKSMIWEAGLQCALKAGGESTIGSLSGTLQVARPVIAISDKGLVPRSLEQSVPGTSQIKLNIGQAIFDLKTSTGAVKYDAAGPLVQ